MKKVNIYFWCGVILLQILFAGYLALSKGWIELPEVTASQNYSLIVILVAALLDSINPCAFSILFLSIGFLFSLGKNRQQVVRIGLTYILGIGLTYLAIGIIGLQILNYFSNSNVITTIGAIIMITVGMIELCGVLIPNFPIRLQIPNFTKGILAERVAKGMTFVGALVLGVLVGLFEFPCTGGPYLFVMSLLHGTEFVRGLVYLILYNLVFILPLIILLVLSSNGKVAETIDKMRREETKKFSLVVALLMIQLGVIILI